MAIFERCRRSGDGSYEVRPEGKIRYKSRRKPSREQDEAEQRAERSREESRKKLSRDGCLYSEQECDVVPSGRKA